MIPDSKWWPSVISSALLLLTVVLFHYSTWDLQIQQHWFDQYSRTWAWPRDEPLLKFVLYDGIKVLLVGYAAGLLLMLIASRTTARWRAARRPALIALLTVILCPLLVGLLKATTNVPCPRNVEQFGGTLPYIGVLDRWPPDSQPQRTQKCFPAGHASGGFALIALMLFGSTRRQRVTIATGALTIGWVMGLYKMVIGDHFLSHTLVSMFLACFVMSALDALAPRPR